MKKPDHGTVLRWGFGLFFLFWGIERVLRAGTWASPDFLGSFYGEMGTLTWGVIAVGVVEIVVALSLFFNKKTKLTAMIGFVIVGVSTIACLKPFFAYFIMAEGAPVPNMLFIDHAPILAGLYAIWDHA